MRKFIILFTVLLVSSCSSKKNITSIGFQQEIEHHREEYKADFVKDERSPLKNEDLSNLQFFEPNEDYACQCAFQPTPDSKPFEMATYSGMTKPYKKYGIATCMINNTSTEISVYQNLRLLSVPGYKDYLFVPFKDFTNSESTYGGGRYINMKTSDVVDDKVTIDFNKCYNPWCAYSDGYNCPIPPLENHLKIEILAGEKQWTGKKKK